MERPITRRESLFVGGAAGTSILAGCLGDDSGGDGDEIEPPDGSNDDDEPTDDTGEDGDRPDLPTRGVIYGFTQDAIVGVEPTQSDPIEIESVPDVTWGDQFVGPEYLYAVDQRRNQVHALDLTSSRVTATVDVGSDPEHGMYDETTGRAYVHIDDDADLFAISGADPDGVDATIDIAQEGHGKVRITNDGVAYLSNVVDGGVFEVDLAEETVHHHHLASDHDDHHHSITRLSTVEQGSVRPLHGDGAGTHFIQYAEAADLVFVEEMDDGHHHSHHGSNQLEFLHNDDDDHDHNGGQTVIYDPAAETVIETLHIAGPIFKSSDGEEIAIIDDGEVHFVDALADTPEVVASVDTGETPAVVRFSESYAIVINEQSGDVAFVDRDSHEITETIPVTDQLMPSAQFGDEMLVTAGKETVFVIDISEREITNEIDINGLQYVQFVPEEIEVLSDARY